MQINFYEGKQMKYRDEQKLILNVKDNLTFGSTIGEAITSLVKQFNWNRSTLRPTANFFTDIDGFNDVVFLRKFKITDESISAEKFYGGKAEVINILDSNFSVHTELFLTQNAVQKWLLDLNQRPRLLFLLKKNKISGEKNFRFEGVFQIDKTSTDTVRVYKKIAVVYNRKVPFAYKKINL